MYHSFSHRPSQSAPSETAEGPRQVNKSCSECTRRRIKCDSGQPCSACRRRETPEACRYRERSKRHAASRGELDVATTRMQLQSRVLDLLFPGHPLESLVVKSRAELLGLLTEEPYSMHQAGQLVATPVNLAEGFGVEYNSRSDTASENGEPGSERRWDESAQQPATIGASDDNDAANLASERHRHSYLGITSTSAVLKTIFFLCPATEKAMLNRPTPTLRTTLPTALGEDSAPGANTLREQRYIHFYFEHIHAITPFLLQDEFCNTYSRGTRQDRSWLGLLNMVLALGSITSGSDAIHAHYYNRAHDYIDFDSLGSGNLESLQALSLLAGYYLHYRNSPNMAFAVLGAAHRVAVALGLHREPTSGYRNMPESDTRQTTQAESRRRTWWSLFCLDTWTSMTLGRPTCGRWDSSTMNTNLPNLLFPEDYVALSLRASVQFCHICNRIQHRIAQFSRITAAEAQALDQELVAWYNSLPDVLRTSPASAPQMTVARESLRGRFLNTRVLLSRCFLLYRAQDIRDPGRGTPSPQEDEMVEACQAIAVEAIDAIALSWTPNRVQVWHASWHLFQACMALLLSITLATQTTWQSRFSSERVSSWSSTVANALAIFDEMRPWMRGTDRAPDNIADLLKSITSTEPASPSMPILGERDLDFASWSNEHLIDINWNLLLNEDYIFSRIE